MSVPVNQRSHGKLEACVKTHEIAVYSIKILANRKTFTAEYASFISKIESAAIDIHSFAWSANGISVTDTESYTSRIALQQKAISECGVLLSYIDIAKNLFHLDTKRVKYWSTMVIEAKKLLRAWRDSDKKRYAEHKGM